VVHAVRRVLEEKSKGKRERRAHLYIVVLMEGGICK
jgi:hypothetical protein